jgi:hypothetical protein
MKSRFFLLATAASVAAISCTDTVAPTKGCDRGVLAPGASATGTVLPACTTPGEFSETYVDYHVTLVAGERYLFTVRSESEWKPALYLVTPAGVRVPGWSDANTGTGAHSELLFVSPYNGPVTLHVVAATQALGRYTISSSQCGGSSEEIYTDATVGTEGSIAPTDCVVHDRYLPADSTHADSYVLYLDRDESKTVTVTARGASAGTFHPAIIFSGPYLSGESTSSQHAVGSSSETSLTMQLTGGNQAGRYILAVGGADPGNFGDYTLTVGPPAP